MMFESEGGVKMVLVATDNEVYSTLQPFVDDFCRRHNEPAITLDAVQIRQSLPRSWDLANCLIELQTNDKLTEIAQAWLQFARKIDEAGNTLLGGDLIKLAIDDLLSPLPSNPKIAKFEIALQIDTGNTLYREFTDVEEALNFIQTYFQSHDAILREINPSEDND